MDEMDAYQIEDVPDTPDRLSARNRQEKRILDRQSNMSIWGRENHSLLDGAPKRMSRVNDNGVRKLLDRSSLIPRVSGQCSSSKFDLGNPSSSNKFSTPQRRVTNDVSSNECNHFMSAKDYNKMACAHSYAVEGGPIVELKERIGACKKILPCEVPGISRDEKNGKKLQSISSSSHSNASSPIIPCFANKDKEAENTGSGFTHGNIVNCVDKSNPKVDNGKVASTSLSFNTTHKVSGQKRLVRNGCISPLNIARAKESVGKEKMESDLQLNLTLPVASSSPLNKVGGKEWIGDDLESLKSKGKGIMLTPLKVKEPEAKRDNLASRNSVSIKEIVKEYDHVDHIGGWRSTRNRSKIISFPPLSHENWHRSFEKGGYLIS